VIYYPLDELSGNVANDQSSVGGTQNATAVIAQSNWQPTAGVVGGALQFSPTAQADVDEALSYSNATPILNGLPFTLSVWINTVDLTNRNHAALYFGNSAVNDQYYAVGTPGTGFPQLVARNPTAINTPGPTTISDGVWHQVTAVFAAPNARSLYVDGMLAATSTTNVPHPSVIRFGIGGLTRATQTDAFSGLLDEVGLFDTAHSAAEVALLNAFPRYDSVPLSDTDYADALTVFTNQTGSVSTGTWTWRYATGLSGNLGTTGLSGGNPFVVLDNAGNGLAAIPEPHSLVFLVGAIVACAMFFRRRKAAWTCRSVELYRTGRADTCSSLLARRICSGPTSASCSARRKLSAAAR
jgi:hypothetical protein